MRHVISLSTIPPRFDQLGPALTSLLRQASRPEAVELYIPRHYRRFPDWGGAPPEVPEGVRVVRVEEDLGPATKVLPAARAWRGQGVELIYVDDDRILDRQWTRRCLAQRRSHPDTAICGAGFGVVERYGFRGAESPVPQAVKAADPAAQFRYQFHRLAIQLRRQFGGTRRTGHALRFERSGYIDIAEGYGGVMVRPEFFDDAAFAIPPVLWTVDDVWLSGSMARRGIRIWADKSLYRVSEAKDVSLTAPLYKAVIEGANRRDADMACIDHMRRSYGIWGGVADQST